MDDEMKKTIKQFNDEFMFIWYKGREHIIARDEYFRVFSMLLPKYFAPLANEGDRSTTRIEKR